MALVSNIFGLLALVIAILVIYDVLANQKNFSTGKKVLWIVLVLLFNIITGIVYYFLYKK